MYTSFGFVISYVAKSRTRTGFRLSGEDFVTASLQPFAKVVRLSIHRVGRVFQRVIHSCDRSAFLVAINTGEELVPVPTALERLWALFEAIDGEAAKQFVRCSDVQLYTRRATTADIPVESFPLVQRLPLKAKTAVRALGGLSQRSLHCAVFL